MAIYQVIGDALLTQEELINEQAHEDLAAFAESYANLTGDVAVELATGTLTAKNMITELPGDDEVLETVPFESVGLGKPLTIEIRHVYTGRNPGVFVRDVFGGGADLLVTSAMKSTAVFDAAPRALNFLKRNVGPRSRISGPDATTRGTSLVHYTPALVERSTVLTVEMAFDQFNEAMFKAVSSLFTQAAGLPVFLSAGTSIGPLLLAGNAITKIAGGIAENLIDRRPVFQQTESLDFYRPGVPSIVADYRLVLESDVDPAFRKRHGVGADGVLMDLQTGEPYQGEIPYMVISLDGRAVPEYEDFAPTAASADLLDKFYSMGEGEASLEPLIEGLKLYNDLKFRRRADDLAEQLEAMEEGTPAYEELLRDYRAAVANIRDEHFEPPEEPGA